MATANDVGIVYDSYMVANLIEPIHIMDTLGPATRSPKINKISEISKILKNLEISKYLECLGIL